MAKAYCFSYGEVFEAYEDCIKNKRNTSNAREFEIDYIEKVTRLCDDINDGTYEIGKSIAFVVTFQFIVRYLLPISGIELYTILSSRN